MLSFLANHLWQSTLFAVAAGMLTLLLRNDAARVRYWLWFAASVNFLVPFSLLAMIGGRLAAPAVVPPAVGEWSTTAGGFAQPVTFEGLSTAPVGLLILLWACGFVAVLGLWRGKRARLKAILRSALPGAALQDCPIPVRYTPERIAPGVAGIFRPVLLLPQGIEQRLSAAQLRAVIAHELCHWRRRDNLTAAVHRFVEALFWFHPLVWWIGARLVEERERACDEAVVSGGADRRAYAEALLDVCRMCLARPLPCAAGMSGADLKRRVTAIMGTRPPGRLHAAKRLLLVTAAAVVLLAPLAGGLLSHGPGTALAQEDADYMPVVQSAPVYPREALARRLEGHVTVEYTVTEDGSVRDVRILDSTDPIFEQPTIDAVSQFRYAPRIVAGNPVEVPEVRFRITFELAD